LLMLVVARWLHCCPLAFAETQEERML